MFWGISSVGRAIGSQSIGQGFESPILHYSFNSHLNKLTCSSFQFFYYIQQNSHLKLKI